MITLNRADLDFLLQQVTINYLAPDANNPGQVTAAPFNYSLLANALDPSGLREVSGSNNNLVGGYWDATANNGQGAWITGPNTNWGQANQPFLNQSVGQSLSSAPASAYNTAGGAVVDTDPRIISNLVATMFTTGPNANPAAIAAATNADPLAQNHNPDIGFVANAGVLGGGRYNAWFVAFGQFFDHGLDFVLRDPDPSATITINLSPNDPLYDADGADNIPGNFDDVTSIKVRRADVANVAEAGNDGIFGTTDDLGYSAGPDGIQGTSDDVYAKAKYINNTGLLIDQSQTYGSHESVNALIREYDASGRPTGRVVTGNTAVLDTPSTLDDSGAVGLATWADIKINAARIGLILTDNEIHNAPMLRVDPVGKLLFTPGANDWTVSTAWNAFNGQLGPYSAALQDPTDPFLRDANGNVQFTGQDLLIDFNPNQSLDSHIITGDGRANENIGLTAVHHVFHEEHNALVGNIQASIIAEYNTILAADGQAAADAFIGPWQSAPGVWDGEKLYQAARLITESEYNHIAIDQYVGTLYGALPEFVSYSSDINMGVSLEFSQAVFRLGHSMLTETFNVDVPNDQNNPNAGTHKLTLLEAFLNPNLYADLGPQALALGLTTTLGNEVDEFVTPALQQTLLGQPLDLATINLARGRDVGLPTWNEFRQQVYDQLIQNTNNTNGSALAPYTNWADVGVHLKNEGTLVNLIAAYARGDGNLSDNINPLTDAIVQARIDYDAGNVTIDVLRNAAQALYDAYLNANDSGHSEAVAFMHGTPSYNETSGEWTFAGADQGFWDIDLWIGGLAERPLFDGPLGTTFSYVILDFAQRMQDGDRFYYLFRTPMGTHLGNEIIENQFGNLVMDHTGLDHLNGEVFIWANATFNLTAGNDYFNAAEHVITDVDGTEMVASDGHLVISGAEGHDYIAGGLGDDTIYGDAGNDQIYGSQGNDHLFGGDGNDYIFDDENDDFITGGAGNDRIFAGPGAIDTVFGDEGDDEIHGGDGIDELLGGTGDDLIYGDGDTDVIFGEEGNDYLEGGDSVDEVWGGGGNDWLRGGVGDDHLQGLAGNDLLEGGIGPAANDGDRLIGEGGLDFGLGAIEDLGFDVASYEDVNVAVVANLDTSNQNGTGPLIDTYVGIDGLVGTRFDDNLTGAGPGTISANGINNLLIGGAGDDILTGLGGDDIIVGDAVTVHNDFTLDNTSPYTTIANWKGTGEDRPDFGGATGLGYFLGDNGAAGSDVAVFSGPYNDGNGGHNYTIEAITHNGYDAIRITDLRDPATEGFDGTDILIGVETARFSDGDVSLVNVPPDLQLHAFDSGNYLDQFDATSYSNSNGSASWTSSWSETDDGAGTSATNGQIRISSSQLQFRDGNGAAIERTVNLAGVTAATLAFDFDENGLDGNEQVQVFFAPDGINFTLLQTLDSSAGESSSNIQLTGPFTANASVRFVVNNITGGADNVFIDNVTINFEKPAAVPTVNNSTTYIEDGAAIAIAAGPGITDDGTEIHSAKIVLINAQNEDVLLPNDIPGDGITSAVDNSVSGQITINLTGVASLAAYQKAIQAITFNNTSQDPSTSNRTIEVSVNDGLADSNVAIATVQVTAANDLPDAANDRLITNIASANFAAPEWAFLANDTDPDNTLDITAVGGASGIINLSLATTPGSITLQDNGAGGGSFNYTASDGSATDLASVNVVRDTAGNIDGGFLGNLGNEILVGDASNSTFVGGVGNDVIFAGGGNDTINWNVNNVIFVGEVPDGHDFVDGGAGTADKFVVNGGNSAETFRVYARADAIAAGITGLNADTEIVITRNGTDNASVIAELDNIEEITINTGGGADTVIPIGNFSPTSLNFNTITINGTSQDDTVDISQLGSDHRIVFHQNGGNDTVVGNLRPQDIVDSLTGSDELGDDRPAGDPESPRDSQSPVLDSDVANTSGPGLDLMEGGPGRDRFDVNEIDHPTTGEGNRGVIFDFFSRPDALDFRPIDANRGQAGDQSFASRGTEDFSAAGHLRCQYMDTDRGGDAEPVLVQGNVCVLDGNGADFEALPRHHTNSILPPDVIL